MSKTTKDQGSQELEEDLARKIATGQVGLTWVAICQMNQCTRGRSLGVAIAIEDSEGIANQKAEAHRNDHRQHEKKAEQVLSQHRAKVAQQEANTETERHGPCVEDCILTAPHMSDCEVAA
jgi:hypothetical protein